MDECQPLPLYFPLGKRTVSVPLGFLEVGLTSALGLRLTLTKDHTPVPLSRGLHSSTFRFNVMTFCWKSWVHDFPPVYQTSGHGEV